MAHVIFILLTLKMANESVTWWRYENFRGFKNENLNSLLKFDTECKIYIYENRNKSFKVHDPDGEALFNINPDGIGNFELLKSLTFTLNKTVIFDIRIYNDTIEYDEN